MSWAGLEGLDFDVIGGDGSLAVGVLERVGRVAARADVGGFSDDELLSATGSLERARRLLDAAEAHVLAEAETRGVTVDRRGLRTGQWVAWETGESIPAAVGRVSLSVRLRTEFPIIDQALVEGRIGWSHAQVLVHASNPRIARQFQDKLPFLIGLAQELAFVPWCKQVRRTAARLDFDGGYRPEDDPEASKLFIDRLSGDDLTLLRGMFTGATGTVIGQIIEERANQIRNRLQRDHTATNGAIGVPRRPVLRAMALEELLLEARAADPTRSTAPVTDLTVVVHWDVSDLFPDGVIPDDFWPQGLKPTPTTPAGAMLGDWAGPGATIEALFEGGRFNSRSIPDILETFDGCEHCETSMQDRLCDPAINILLVDEHGCPLKLGRTRRFASPDQRRAATARDGGCTFPGCDRPGNWCDLHHVDPYDNGGDTDIDNLACLCRFHHGITHRTGWAMIATSDGWFEWHTPNGDTLPSQRHQQQRAGPAPNTP